MKQLNTVPASEVTLDTIIHEAVLFNAETTEDIRESCPVGGNPTGLIDPEGSPFSWAFALQEVMYNNDWRPKEVDLSADKAGYRSLDEKTRNSVDRVVSSLIFNDSCQTRNLAANYAPFITDGILLICIVRQTYEETVHTLSYDVIVSDVSDNKEYIHSVGTTDPMLIRKNSFLEKMYSKLAYTKGDGVTVREFMIATIANNILEGMLFYAGFVFLWALAKPLPGTAQMISFISRDEKTHVLLFRQIFTSILKKFPKIDRVEIGEILSEMIKDAADMEIEWLKDVAVGVLPGFSLLVCERYIHNKADELVTGLGYPAIYNDEESPLIGIEKAYDDPNKTKGNVFEVTPRTYSAKKLSTDDF